MWPHEISLPKQSYQNLEVLVVVAEILFNTPPWVEPSRSQRFRAKSFLLQLELALSYLWYHIKFPTKILRSYTELVFRRCTQSRPRGVSHMFYTWSLRRLHPCYLSVFALTLINTHSTFSSLFGSSHFFTIGSGSLKSMAVMIQTTAFHIINCIN